MKLNPMAHLGGRKALKNAAQGQSVISNFPSNSSASIATDASPTDPDTASSSMPIGPSSTAIHNLLKAKQKEIENPIFSPYTNNNFSNAPPTSGNPLVTILRGKGLDTGYERRPKSTPRSTHSNDKSTTFAASADALDTKSTNTFATATTNVPPEATLAVRTKKPSPTLNGSPIKKKRTLPTSIALRTKATGKSKPAAKSEEADTSSVLIDLPGYNPNYVNTSTYQPPTLQRTTYDYAASNLEITDDPLDWDCPVDLANLEVDANGAIRYIDPYLAQTPSNYSSIKTAMRWTLPDPGMFKGPNWFRTFSRCQQPVRYIFTRTDTTMEQYHQLADEYIDSMVEALEAIEAGNEEVECEFSNGVVNFTYPPWGTWVINKQPATKQIWLSSPISGPKRFDYREVSTEDHAGYGIHAGKWIYDKDGERVSLSALMEQELNTPLHLEGEGRIYDRSTYTWKSKP